MNALKIPALLSIALLAGPACTKKDPAAPSPTPTPAVSDVLTTTGKALAKTKAGDLPFQLYRFLAADPKNVSLSPISLEQAFAMVYLGSNGTTKAQLEELFGFKGDAVESIASEALPKEIELQWGNSLWAKPGKTLSPSYLQTVREKLDASFTPSLDVSKINGWVSEQTRGKIPKVIDQLDLRTVVVLVNALYLKAPWRTPFREETNQFGPFQSSPHQTINTVFMGGKTSLRYHETETARWVELPYQGDTLAMILALPKKRFDLRAVEEQLSGELIEKVAAGLRKESVDLRLPRFTIESSLSLRKLFVSLGYEELFEKGDFSRMTLMQDVRFGQILQATYLRVDEKGTEAAAATGVSLEGTDGFLDEPKQFYANEPFLFLIRNQKTGKLWFLGRVYDPKL